MKRFIIISLMALLALPAAACMWVETHNKYLFHVYCADEFRDKVEKVCNDNWKAYLGEPAEANFWFDAEKLIAAANAKNDALMASYVKYLDMYVDICNEVYRDRWEYPTSEDLNDRNRRIEDIRLYASSKLKTRLRSQHALLFMRCNMLLGRHAENITFWENTASGFIDTIYKEMMRNIYAGALTHDDRCDEAGVIFAEQGDWQSLMTTYFNQRSFEAIRDEYLRDANSPVLPFLLQDFVNNVQEAVHNDANAGKLFIRDIQRSEAQQMIGLAQRAVANSAVQHPALWQAAKAWLEYMLDNHRQAATDIDAAVAMEGTDKEKENVRVLRFYIHSAIAPLDDELNTFIAQELQWMSKDEEKMDDSSEFYYAVDRTMHQVLMPKYRAAGRMNQLLGLQAAVSDGGYWTCLDTIPVNDVIAYREYLQQPATNTLDAYIKPRALVSAYNLEDLIGVKYMRERQWEQAIQWLQDIPVAYYADMGIAAYCVLRKWTVEPWITRQWCSDEQLYGDEKPTLTFNPRLAFARDMLKKEQGLQLLKGDARYQRCYDLAVRYAQADGTGDCWYLVNHSKTIDYERKMEPFAIHAVELLQEAARSKQFNIRERALFALSYYYLNPEPWYTTSWNSEIGKQERTPMPDVRQYRAFAALVDFERQHPDRTSDFVSRCDEYRQFIKYY